MPLMGSLYIGVSGLQTSQNALNTTAHNMSNLDTKGYVRQQVCLSDSSYNTISIDMSAISNKQLGLGVTYSSTRQVRSYFLDQLYRKESSKSAFYSTSADTISEIEDLFGELYGVSFSDSLGNLQEAVEELVKTPSDTVKQGLLLQRSSEFISNAQAVYSGLKSYQSNMNDQVKKQVETINKYGQKIRELNLQIAKVEASGVENANDLRDSRNQLLDELSAMVSISYEEDANNTVSVSIEGVPFVTPDSAYEIGLKQDPTTGFYTPFWTQNAKYTLNDDGSKNYDITNAEVFDLDREISEQAGTAMGSLKALVLARGDHAATYEDLLDTDYYNDNISQSIMMNVEAEFDKLVHSVATAINDVLKAAADRATALDPASTYMRDSNGNPFQMFETISGTVLTTSNMQINKELQEQPSKLGFILADKSEDKETAEALQAAFQNVAYNLNPNLTKKSNFSDYYSDLISQISNSGKVYNSLVSTQESTVASVDAARQQISGVSQDEELTNMVKYQNAYNAASRYINVVDEMLEHIINTLGR